MKHVRFATTWKMLSPMVSASAAILAFSLGTAHPGLAQTAALDALYEAAKGEGKVNLDGPWSVQQMQPLLDAFEAKYPGIDASYANVAPMPQTIAVVITEAQTGTLSLDATTTTPSLIRPYLDSDTLLEVGDWADLGVSEHLVGMGGRYVRLHDNPYVIAYNTQLVQEDEIPKSWDDLLDPRWGDGQIILDSRGFFLAGLAPEHGLGLEKVLELAAGLEAQDPIFVSRAATAVDQLAAGQGAIANVPLGFLVGKMAVGAPVNIAPVSPASSSSFGVSIMKSAKNVNAAKLWVTFMASPEARSLLDAAGIGFADPCGGTPMGELLCSAKVELAAQTIDSLPAELEARPLVAQALGTAVK